MRFSNRASGVGEELAKKYEMEIEIVGGLASLFVCLSSKETQKKKRLANLSFDLRTFGL